MTWPDFCQLDMSVVLQLAAASVVNENWGTVIACDCNCEREIGRGWNFDGDWAAKEGRLDLLNLPPSPSNINLTTVDCSHWVPFWKLGWVRKKMGGIAIWGRQIGGGTTLWQRLNVANKDWRKVCRDFDKDWRRQVRETAHTTQTVSSSSCRENATNEPSWSSTLSHWHQQSTCVLVDHHHLHHYHHSTWMTPTTMIMIMILTPNYPGDASHQPHRLQVWAEAGGSQCWGHDRDVPQV